MVKQTQQELQHHLKDQIGFILNSSRQYDEGNVSEAKNLAIHLRILLHDNRFSTSVLSQLNMKDIEFYDSVPDIDDSKDHALYDCSLSYIHITTKGERKYVPYLDDIPLSRDKQKSKFDHWWTKTILIDTKGNKFSRKDLVLSVANQDGGAHVDPNINDKYAGLSRNNTMGWEVTIDGKTTNLDNEPVFPSIRQIAHEVVKSLRQEDPTVFD
jgi:hypothetical protein